MEYTQILYEVSDRILTITLSRPEKMNAFTHVMCKELIDALHRADDDDEVRVIIITGAGKAFCAGTDLESAGGNQGQGNRQLPEGFDPERDIAGMVTLTMFDLKKPVIAAYNGVAVGVGLTMTLAADVRIASENARFGLVFTRRAFVSEGASNWFLPRIVGMGKAAEWILTGRVFGVQEALAARLVTEVLPTEGLIPRAREIAQEIVQNTSPVSVALCRQLLWKMVGTDHPMEAHKMESKMLSWMTKKPDVIEGVMSFLEKRRPNFSMKPSKDMPGFYPWWPDRPFRP